MGRVCIYFNGTALVDDFTQSANSCRNSWRKAKLAESLILNVLESTPIP